MAPDRDDWATIVAKVLPFVLPRECSGTKHEQTVGMRDGNSLVATRCLELPPHRQVPEVNPTGTCMPSALAVLLRDLLREQGADKGSTA